jgi:hypothetical protein
MSRTDAQNGVDIIFKQDDMQLEATYTTRITTCNPFVETRTGKQFLCLPGRLYQTLK